MITWPIFVALILATAAVYFQIKREDGAVAKKEEEERKKTEKEKEEQNLEYKQNG